MSYDLLEQPWVPVIGEDGLQEVSLREAFESAHQVRLAAAAEEHTVLLRLLLAVFAAAARPADTGQWDTAWAAPALDRPRISGYLDTVADRFDLFSDTRPFFQCASLTAPNRDARSLLVGSWSSGAPQFAALPSTGPAPLEPAEAVVGLLMLQCWHPGGIQTGHPADPATRGGKVYGGKPGPLSTMTHLRLTGRSLRDELLLNCPPGTRTPGDSPVWERDSPAAPMQVREPAGMLDAWTWPTRRVRLFTTGPAVTGIALHDGDRPAEPDAVTRLDPGACVTARGHRLPVTDGARHPLPWAPAALLAPTPESGSCPAVDHAAAAAARGTLPADMPVAAVLLRAEHTTPHRAALSGIDLLNAPIGPAGVLGDPVQRAALAAAARLPWQVQRDIVRCAEQVLPATGLRGGMRPGLSLAARLGPAWEHFAADPAGDGEADTWHDEIAAALASVTAGGGGRGLMATAQIQQAGTDALARATTTPVPNPAPDAADGRTAHSAPGSVPEPVLE